MVYKSLQKFTKWLQKGYKSFQQVFYIKKIELTSSKSIGILRNPKFWRNFAAQINSDLLNLFKIT